MILFFFYEKMKEKNEKCIPITLRGGVGLGRYSVSNGEKQHKIDP